MRSMLCASSVLIVASVASMGTVAACDGSSGDTKGTGGSTSSSTSASASSGAGGNASSSSSGGSSSSSGGSGGGNVSPPTFECPMGVTITDIGTALATADETWTADKTYRVIGTYSTGPHTLTIEAGTVVCFTYGGMPSVPGNIRVAEGGTLNINGTPEKHVILTRRMDFGPTDAWGGIDYDSNVMKPGIVENADFYFAGDSSAGDVINTFGDTKLPPLDYRNVTFRMHQRTGIKNGTSGWTPESNLHFISYDTANNTPDYYDDYSVLYMHPYGLKTLTATTITVDPAVPAQVKYVQLDHPAGEPIDQDVTMHKLATGLSYYLLDTTIEGNAAAPNTWTIEPGIAVAIDAGTEFRLGTGGSGKSNLVAAGTAAEPIVFTSAAVHHGAQPVPGDWNGIMFNPGNFDPMKTRLDFVTFEYGGGASPQGDVYNCNDMTSGYAEIEFGLAALNQEGPGPSITNSTFQKSAGQAIRIENSTGTPSITTDYTAAALKNTFLGFTTPPAVYPAACP